MKKILFLFFILAFAGCKEYDGQLLVTEAFDAIVDGGFFGQDKKISVPVGTYTATLNIESPRSASVLLKVNGKKRKIKMNIPSNRIPQENGEFQISAQELEQPFLIAGTVNTNRSEGPRRRDIESCTFKREREVCTQDPKTGQMNCRVEQVTTSGQQRVEYYMLYTERIVGLQIFPEQHPGEAVGSLSGRNSEQEKVYISRDYCR